MVYQVLAKKKEKKKNNDLFENFVLLKKIQ